MAKLTQRLEAKAAQLDCAVSALLIKDKEEIERLSGELESRKEVFNKMSQLVRNQLWIAYVWNDHNFQKHPYEYAREAAKSVNILSFESANEFIERIGQLRQQAKEQGE